MLTLEFHGRWMEQCDAAVRIKARYGLSAAFRYLVGEKLFNLVANSRANPDFRQQLPLFAVDVRHIFGPREIVDELAALRRTVDEATAVASTDDQIDDDALPLEADEFDEKRRHLDEVETCRSVQPEAADAAGWKPPAQRA